ncbi:MAG: malonyl-CoA decarboxylase [Alphaproteobacteria bacterium]|nr:malonyl-CoA decarboxylase [Alphaproteobacteria bacterium]
MSLLADLLSTAFDRASRYVSPGKWDERPVPELVAELIGSPGEVRGMELARQILDKYATMDDTGRAEFFELLAMGMDIDAQAVRTTLSAYEKQPSKSTYSAFMDASEPPRQELIRRLNQASNATASLVAMRDDLIKMAKKNASFAALDLDFKHLFSSWFNRGFLVLRPINWKSPAHILEKIITYEAVHAIDSWDELRQRLQPSDRRCFAFFHPSMADEPLIFVQVALTRGIPDSIQMVLANDRQGIEAGEADTAVFYSISNCQSGLAGISFGNSLIKQVVEDLSHELPELTTFVTLSPIPGLADWLENEGWEEDLDNDSMPQIAAHYLINAKRPDGLPVDPVARFHLGNGAIVHAIHGQADMSVSGLAQSHGAMVNYLYDLRAISKNHVLYASEHDVVASQAVKTLARAAVRPATKESQHG